MDNSHSILILSRADIAALMRPGDYLAAVEGGFLAAAQGRAVSPPPLHLPADGGGFHAKGALLGGGRSYAALKFNGNFPGNPAQRRLPTIQGLVVLSDGASGTPLAVMDSIEITTRRTAAASAMAARRLARLDSDAIAVCGCGEQGRAHLIALQEVLPLTNGAVWDSDPDKAEAFALEMKAVTGLALRAARDLRGATFDADIIVTCTTAETPFLGNREVAAGAFVAAVGADAPHKSEIKPELMAKASVFVDVLEQCLAMGDLRHAVGAGVMTAQDVRADLAQLASGAQGRARADEIIVFDSTGTAVADAASAVLVYERALAAGAGAMFPIVAI